MNSVHLAEKFGYEFDHEKITIAGLDLKWFLIVAAVIVAGCAFGAFPTGMVGAFLFLMVFGELLNIVNTGCNKYIKHMLIRVDLSVLSQDGYLIITWIMIICNT